MEYGIWIKLYLKIAITDIHHNSYPMVLMLMFFSISVFKFTINWCWWSVIFFIKYRSFFLSWYWCYSIFKFLNQIEIANKLYLKNVTSDISSPTFHMVLEWCLICSTIFKFILNWLCFLYNSNSMNYWQP